MVPYGYHGSIPLDRGIEKTLREVRQRAERKVDMDATKEELETVGRKITDAIPKMTETQKWYLLGFSEAMTMAKDHDPEPGGKEQI